MQLSSLVRILENNKLKGIRETIRARKCAQQAKSKRPARRDFGTHSHPEGLARRLELILLGDGRGAVDSFVADGALACARLPVALALLLTRPAVSV